MPSRQNALSRVSTQSEVDDARNSLLISRQLNIFLSVPLLQLGGSPIERPIDMAQVAGIRPTDPQIVGNFRAADLVAPNRLQDAVGGVRHVTVVTLAS